MTNIIKPQTLKGFRDFLPEEANKRLYVLDIIKSIFEKHGFDPLETPALEYAEVLMGKYGSEADKLLYLFKDHGDRLVGLKYDQTVPLARVIAQYRNQITFPFKRYQIQPVWRAENTQSGRFREFLQCDIDIIGSDSPLSDAEIISCTLQIFKTLGLKNAKFIINDRTVFDKLGITKKEIIIIDKLDKIGKEKVISELSENGRKNPAELLELLEKSEPSERIQKIIFFLEKNGFVNTRDFSYYPYLARGLEYYTSTIYEVKIPDINNSLAGGGRYDNLIGLFSGTDYAAVGIAFGFDRIMQILNDLNLLPKKQTATDIIVIPIGEELLEKAIILVKYLREKSVPTEISLLSPNKLDKQIKYADKKGIPYIAIIGPDEAKNNTVTLKNLKQRTQKTVKYEEIPALLG